ncbi:hypothetical protein ACLMJK_007692 [Lecanora helva]
MSTSDQVYHETQSALADLLEVTVHGDDIQSCLDGGLIELPDSGSMHVMETLETTSHIQTFLQLIRYCVYLTSNNLISNEKLDKFTQTMRESGMEWIIMPLFDSRTPSIVAFGSRYLRSAASLGYFEPVQSLLQKPIKANLLAKQRDQDTVLHQAVKGHNPDIVRLLLDAGADLTQEVNQSSLLYHAVLGPRSIEMVQLLVDHNIRVNHFEHRCPEILVSAIKNYCDIEVIRVLIDAGVSVKACCNHETPLQAAVDSGMTDVVELLIQSGAAINDLPPNWFDRQSMLSGKIHADILATPLQRASWAEDTETAQILVSNDSLRNEELTYRREELTPLQSASYKGNASLVRLLLAANANAEMRPRELLPTPLQFACAQNSVEIVQILLGHGAHVNAPASQGGTALQVAIKTGNLDLVHLLLGANADVNAMGSPDGGRTALQAAAASGSLELVELSIGRGADINAEPMANNGLTCLQAAVTSGNIALVLVLLDRGADVNSPPADVKGRTALQAAVMNRDVQMCHLLLRAGSEVNGYAARSGGRTALQAAVENFDKEHSFHKPDSTIDEYTILYTLLDAGADVDAPSAVIDGSSAFAAAVRTEYTDLARLILENMTFPIEYTEEAVILQRAISTGSIDLVKIVIEAKADVDHRADGEWYSGGSWRQQPLALQWALWTGKLEIANLLVEAGAFWITDPPSSCAGNELQLAVYGSAKHAVRYLLCKGVSPNQSKHMVTILDTAIKNGDGEIASLLFEAGADVNRSFPLSDSLFLAVKYAHVSVTRLLLQTLQKRTALNQKDISIGNTLEEAARQGDMESIRMLIDAGADVNRSSIAIIGRTILQVAATAGHIQCVKLLLANGADVNGAVSLKGTTALQGAVTEGNIKMVIFLLEAGAQISAPRGSGYRKGTALERAAKKGRLDIVSLLLKNYDDSKKIRKDCENAARRAAKNGFPWIEKMLHDHVKGLERVEEIV